MDGMLDWMKGRGARAIARPVAAVHAAQEARANAGEYQLLYKYLRDRYADRVVLTFAEIEDLLGFALPQQARAQSQWHEVNPAVCRLSLRRCRCASTARPAQRVAARRAGIRNNGPS